MLWASLFIASIAQALFLISLVLLRSKKNKVASTLIVTMLAVMILPNLSCLSLISGIYHDLPDLFGISFGISFLFGPLFYLYARTILDSSFKWKWGLLIHFIPYLLYKIAHLWIYRVDPERKVEFVEHFLSGDLVVHPVAYLFFAAQNMLLFAYLALSFQLIRSARIRYSKEPYIMPIANREWWLRQLLYCFSLFLLVGLAYLATLLLVEKYIPMVSYLSTLLISSILYFIAYRLVINPDLIIPDFTQKYKSYRQLENAATEGSIKKLRVLMEEDRAFADSELNLTSLSAMVGLTSHQLSKLINQEFGKSFPEFINEYRIQEFVRRIDKPEFQTLSIYGIALDVGFRSKSSFNTTFKKVTGQIPSAYRKSTKRGQ